MDKAELKRLLAEDAKQTYLSYRKELDDPREKVSITAYLCLLFLDVWLLLFATTLTLYVSTYFVYPFTLAFFICLAIYVTCFYKPVSWSVRI